MCGICGYYRFDSKSVTSEDIKSMCNVIVHRGPDDEGIYIDGSFGMGMRRLSIIDLDTGHQPISNENDSVSTVLNGEIYNYIELTEDLKKKGHIFKTKTDTEVLVHLYEEYGLDFIKLLRGMFGFAIWDKNKKELILVRDPLGIKQLYFFKDDNKFLFSSEIKSILKVLDKPLGVNYAAFIHYLTFLYLPDDFTIFENIVKLKPGHFMVIRQNGITNHEYWNLSQFQQLDINFAEAQREFMRMLEESIKLHLRSDVPLGVFLSGGLDSSIITAIGSRLTDKPLNTFTIGYGQEGAFYDEKKFARIIANQFKTNHHEYTITPDIEKAIYKLIYYFDEPFANSSAIPTYYICQMMRKEVKVALSGLGGDEIAGGYERYAGMKLLQHFRRLPAFLIGIAKYVAEAIPDSKKGSYFSDRTKRFMRAANLSPVEAYYSIISSLSINRKSTVLSDSLKKKLKDCDSYSLYLNIINNSNQNDILRSAMYFDIVSYTTNDLLVLSDRTSMANSLEVRVPFFDHKFVELMFQLPTEYKIKGLQKKYIFKKTFKGILPDEILLRKKQGFSTPLSVWLRDDLLGFSQKIFSKEKVESTGVLDYNGVQVLLNDHLSRKANNQGIIFALLTFIIWHEMYIQNKESLLDSKEV